MNAQQTLINEFSVFDNWLDKYEYLIELGRALPPYPEEWKSEEYIVHGCQAQVWFHAEKQQERLHFEAMSDATIVQGLIALLLRIYNDRSPAEIMATNTDFIQAIGLDHHLSPTRKNGLHHMLKKIYDIAGKYALP